jgi:hypothetical protein
MRGAMIIALTASRPRIEPAAEGGWYCLLGDHGWLCGDRRQALDEFNELVRIEQRGRA